MILHKRIEKWSFPICIALVLIGSALEFYLSFLKDQTFSSFYLTNKEYSVFFMGIAVRKAIQILLLSFCLRALLDRMGFFIEFKRAIAIYAIVWFLPFIITPIFKIVLFEFGNPEMKSFITSTIYWINNIFIICGLIYNLQFLKKEVGLNYRRSIFIIGFIFIMYFFALAPFIGIEL